MQWIIIGILSSYLIGSIPTAYIFVRLLKGADIRNFGSGNVGATNALRILGKGPGITVLVIDMLKGLVVVVFLANILAAKITNIPEISLRVMFGLSCIFGHIWTVFLKFKGGKGVATTLGVLLGLSITVAGIQLFLCIILTWLLVFLLTKIVSISSIITGISLPLYMALFKQPGVLIYSSIFLCALIIIRHKSNLKRLLQGKEPRLSFKKSA